MEVTNNGGEMESKSKFHVVMFPWFAFGHINPFILLANKLTSHGVQITFLSIPGNISRIKSSLNLTSPNQIIPLTIPPIEGLDPEVDISSFISSHMFELLNVALDQMEPQVKSILSRLQPNIVLFDFAQHWLPRIASPLGIKSVKFSVFSAVSDAYLIVPSRMTNSKEPPSSEDLKKPPPGFPETSIAGVKTFEGRDFEFLFKSFNGGPSAFEGIMEHIKTCDAIIYKSCVELEGPYIDYLKTQYGKPLLLAGPSVPLPFSGILVAFLRLSF